MNSYYAHPTATVDKPCVIGNGTKIWHYSHIRENAQIGKNCNIGQNVFVGLGVKIGNGVKVQNNVSIYEAVELEDNVFCGPSVVFTNVINPRSAIERKNEFRPIIVREGATLGANATIICGISIGKYAFVGAGAVVTKDIPDYGLVYGNPAKLKGWICACGIKLNFVNDIVKCSTCNKEYILKNCVVMSIDKD